MRTIGVIGTAKNTGKTTTLSFLMKGFLNKGVSLAVTGIGYDGEEVDNITLLPKPRLYFEKNTVVATSEKCLKNSEANFEIISKTSAATPLGKVFIVRITKPGMIVLAGPNRMAALKEIIDFIKVKAGCDVLLVDGSLNRMSPMTILDKLVFTTGASRSVNIKKLVNEMSLIEKVFSFPLTNFQNIDNNTSVIIKIENGEIVNKKLHLDLNNFPAVDKQITTDVKALYISTLLSVQDFNDIIKRIKSRIGDNKIELIINSPVMLLLSGDFSLLSVMLERMKAVGIDLTYIQKPELSAVTINPFYPKLENYHYTSSYVDREAFENEMKSVLTSPVYNIKEGDNKKFFETVNK
jgi:hypothetical protein